ncbi:2-hydroxyacid dehydrogenase [Vampirovibrio sp.]|uniref:2-hydroxyacid dehydrogenase n=1 Tax=Vampirovibrio sp. TaxID=2717857 RepID=UPI0035937E5F
MRVAIFSVKPYDKEYLEKMNEPFQHELTFFEARLSAETVSLASGFEAVCPFVNDQLDAPILKTLAQNGTRLLALRSAGFNHVDLKAAEANGLTVARVPAYSPYAIAEHTVGLMLDLNRNIHRAYNRVREGNFSLDGLMGFDMNGKTVGIVGTGKIGAIVANILKGFGCQLLAYDPYPNSDCIALGVRYTSLETLYKDADIITLHCPLTPDSRHLIDDQAIAQMKDSVMLINTSRGAVVDTSAVIAGLKSGKIGYLGLDVYEEEADLFFEDLSNRVIQDDLFLRLLTFPNVIITGHQAFFTHEAIAHIAHTTLKNIQDFEQGSLATENRVLPEEKLAVSHG